ncbi:dienelactone hydrolase family protein [Phaeobacter marinintestinus]|uniref:dienelactone hydrolase family protein n=1 Tax=Falsiphaeobacter marinintestinus TaxID=1492905 RepID=UPI001644108C|nr:dienelactone hydrolase family protein [Phaeobacter marinintestinus]
MPDWSADRVFPFTAPLSTGQSATHDIHVKGDGPPIILVQELPGIGEETLALVNRLCASGFRVYLVHFLGPFGRKTMVRNTLRMLCVRREINMFLRNRQSPFADWLRALARHVRDQENAKGVGVIGMCLTGHFALTLMADEAVLGSVASQPALPVRSKGDLQMSEQDIAQARAGMADKGPALAMRFTDDKLVPDALFSALKRAFGEHLETLEIDGSDHSLLTIDFRQPAYDRVEAYFHERFALS